MVERRLKNLIEIFLWVALIEDIILFVMAWAAPEIWFSVFHDAKPRGLEVAFLRRSAGQWAAFALVQAITLVQWRKKRVWLAITAGARFSDLFTDISYLLAARELTALGWIMMSPLAFLNLIGVLIMLRGYGHARTRAEAFAPAIAFPEQKLPGPGTLDPLTSVRLRRRTTGQP